MMSVHNQTTQSGAKILLLGGTSETAPLALALAQAGYSVVVSTATDAPLNIGEHPAISRRCGRLDTTQMICFIKQQSICAIVDATHPYATQLHKTARQVAQQLPCPYLRYQRQELQSNQTDCIRATDHQQAALLACKIQRPILLTIGSRNLSSYVDAAKQCQIPLFARVLDHTESIAACDQAGLDKDKRIIGRGPFTLQQNCTLIRQHQIGVIVTKDSGIAGGVLEKIEAASLEGCTVIIVQRPQEDSANSYDAFTSLIRDLTRSLSDLAMP